MLDVWVWASQESWKSVEWLRTSEYKGFCSIDLVGYLVDWCICSFLLLVAWLISFVGCLVYLFCWLLSWFLLLIGLLVAWLVGLFFSFVGWLVSFAGWLVDFICWLLCCLPGCLVCCFLLLVG
jgi:hypothetical protein